MISYILLIISIFVTGCVIKKEVRYEAGSNIIQSEKIAGYPIKRHIQFKFTIQNTDIEASKGLRLWVYLPVKAGSYQVMNAANLVSGAKVAEDPLGNQIMSYDINMITPFDTKIVTVDFEMQMSGDPMGYADLKEGIFFKSEELIESDDRKIKDVTRALKGKDDYETVKKIYTWVSGNLFYAGYVKHDLGARYAIEKKKGDCTEYAALFVAMSRAAGIPARMIGGYVCERDCIVGAPEFHNWAEFYYKGKWHIADPLKKRFDEKGEDYIATEIFSTKNKNQLEGYHRYRYESKGGKIMITG